MLKEAIIVEREVPKEAVLVGQDRVERPLYALQVEMVTNLQSAASTRLLVYSTRQSDEQFAQPPSLQRKWTRAFLSDEGLYLTLVEMRGDTAVFRCEND